MKVNTNVKRNSPEQARAEALFKKQEQAREGQKAMTEYQAEREATLNKTARLRALRLAREAKQVGGAR
jgi:hypothetical protein